MSFTEFRNLVSEKKLERFMETLSVTNRTPEYYVNWSKVVENTREFELELNTLNYLLGKPNIQEVALKLFTDQPQLLKAIPSLIASREKRMDVLIVDEDDLMVTNLDFVNPQVSRLSEYMDFMKNSGLFEFMEQNLTKSLVDYVYGVETGLDSNARKNRSGSTMEGIINRYVKEIADDVNDYQSMSQATADKIQKKWNIKVPVDKSKRKFDESIYDIANNHVYLIETNYYGGGGSKLKSVAGEFSELAGFLRSQPKVTFVWITDGQGWHTAHVPLSEAFDKVDYIFNLEMLQQGYLKELVLDRKFS